MTSDAMRRAWAEAHGHCRGREPLPALRWTALAQWREMAPALIPRLERWLPVADIWLPALLNDLDHRFDQPLQVSDSGPLRTITALGFVRYTIDRDARCVSSAMLAAAGPIEVAPQQFDMACAWQRLGWLRPLLEALPAMRLVDTLLPESHRDGVLGEITKTLTPMVRRDGRLHRLRRELRAALCFDPSLFPLALRTRGDSTSNGVSGERLTDVWQHAAYLRVIEQDAPRLLPVAYTVLDQLTKLPPSEAVKGLKTLLRTTGLTDAGWRYLLKHRHKAIASAGGGGLTIKAVAQMAQALAMAGGHPPPSSALCAAWRPRFMPIVDGGADHKDSVLTWLKNERRLASAILKAAHEAKRTPQYPTLIDDITSVLWWLRDAKIATPRKPLRSLIRAAKAWEADQLAIAQAGQRRWSKPRTVACPDEVHEAVLLDGPVALLEEARVMRNCLRARLPILKARRAQAWSVRRKDGGERVALIEMRRDHARWKPSEIAARFNRRAPEWVYSFAQSLAVCETLRLQPEEATR